MKVGDLVRWKRRGNEMPGTRHLDHLAMVLTLEVQGDPAFITVRWLRPFYRGEGWEKKYRFEVLSEAE